MLACFYLPFCYFLHATYYSFLIYFVSTHLLFNFYCFLIFSLMVARLYISMLLTVRHFTCSIFIYQLCYWYHFLQVLTYVFFVFFGFFLLLFCSCSSSTLMLIIEFWLICILSGYVSFIHFYLLLIFLKLRIFHHFSADAICFVVVVDFCIFLFVLSS